MISLKLKETLKHRRTTMKRTARRPHIVGTGSFTPPTRVSNRELLDMYHPTKPNGDPITEGWIERHLGIKTRALDINPTSITKKSRSEGGLYDSDMAIRVAKMALEDARVEASKIDVIIHVTCTRDSAVPDRHFLPFVSVLGLRKNVRFLHLNLGCAGLAAGLEFVSVCTYTPEISKILLIASNCPSRHMNPELLPQYKGHKNPWAWSGPVVFGDGAGAVVLRFDEGKRRGLICTDCETNPEYTLIETEGACFHPAHFLDLDKQLYILNASLVGQVFAPLMQRNFDMLLRDWPEEEFGSFEMNRVARWYFHQANAHMVRGLAKTMGVPLERVPVNVDTLGNTSAASTLLLLDDDRRNGKVKDGDLVVFMWIGAGNGAMNGYAVFIL